MKPEASVLSGRWSRVARSRRSILASWILLGLAAACIASPTRASTQTEEERRAVPGNYTVGFYAGLETTTREIVLPRGEDRFEVYIAVTGDSTRVFSGLVFRVELPRGLTMDGPIAWRPLPGLRQYDAVEEVGARVSFAESCVQMIGDLPVVVGRMAFRLAPEVKQLELDPLAHRQFGLSVELCQPERGFPKPYATGLGIRVVREQSLWDRVRSWFD